MEVTNILEFSEDCHPLNLNQNLRQDLAPETFPGKDLARYHLLLTSAGGGYSRWQEVSLTRRRADTTLDNWGSWLYIQNEDNGALWSAGYQPTATPSESQRVIFHPHMAEFHRRDHEIALTMEVTVALDDDVEIRLVTLTNESDRPRRLRLTSYGEVSLASPAADERHPAFAKLFVQSEYHA